MFFPEEKENNCFALNPIVKENSKRKGRIIVSLITLAAPKQFLEKHEDMCDSRNNISIHIPTSDLSGTTTADEEDDD
jgi:hypothetical protein